VLTRLSTHGPTRDYMARRTRDGKAKKEIIRCLKRYVAREVHHAITADFTASTRHRDARREPVLEAA
jgi:hypothetical protein